MKGSLISKLTPAEEKQLRIDIVKESITILKTTWEIYQKTPSEYLEQNLLEQKQFITTYRKKHNV